MTRFFRPVLVIGLCSLLLACSTEESPAIAAAAAAPPPQAEAIPAALDPVVEEAPAAPAQRVVDMGPAMEISLPALRVRIETRRDAGEMEAALDDMGVFVLRFEIAPSTEGYRETLREHGREIARRGPAVRRRPAARGLQGLRARRRPGQPRRAQVRIGMPRVAGGGLDREIVRRIFRRHMNQIRLCYEVARQRRPDIEGVVMLEMVIGVDGAVDAVRIGASTLGDARLHECVLQRARRFEFPVSADGAVRQARTQLTLELD